MKAETGGEETSTLERAAGDEMLLVDVSKDDAAGVGGARELSYAKCIGGGDKHCGVWPIVFPSKPRCIS